MILTGDEIARMRAAGRLVIDPFDEKHVGPNSIDLTLAPEVLVYSEAVLDMRLPNPTHAITIPPQGLLIQPGELYLGRTVERCGSEEFVACVDGRSSVGRLGIAVHVTAGIGDLGYQNRWTLEITCVKPVRIYAGVRIAQVVFYATQGKRTRQYVGKYGRQSIDVASQMWRDFQAESR